MKIILPLMLLLTNISFAMADISEPMTINITDNPVSLNGTYDIKRFVIIKDKHIFIDSEDKSSVTSSKGQVTIDLNITNNMITSILKMQMKGSIFAVGSAFADYDFIYSSRIIPMANSNDNQTDLENKISSIGMHYYKDKNRIIWEIPFEQDKIIIMELNKKSNKIKNLSNSKYIFM